CASETERLMATFVLPTPPLPLVTAMTLTGFCVASARRPAAWSRSEACMHHLRRRDPHAERRDVRRIVGPREPLLVERPAEQMNDPREPQVLGDALPVTQPRRGQLSTDQHGQRGT